MYFYSFIAPVLLVKYSKINKVADVAIHLAKTLLLQPS